MYAEGKTMTMVGTRAYTVSFWQSKKERPEIVEI